MKKGGKSLSALRRLADDMNMNISLAAMYVYIYMAWLLADGECRLRSDLWPPSLQFGTKCTPYLGTAFGGKFSFWEGNHSPFDLITPKQWGVSRKQWRRRNHFVIPA